MAEYHEQEEIFKLRLGHLKKVCEAYAKYLVCYWRLWKVCIISLFGKSFKERKYPERPKTRGVGWALKLYF